MKKATMTYEKNFMLTNENLDVSGLNFKFNTYQKEYTDENGYPSVKEYYMTYDPATNIFTDLAVKCTYTYDLTTNNTIARSTEDIEWYFEDGSVAFTKQMIAVYT
jgi:hypothetical protein